MWQISNAAQAVTDQRKLVLFVAFLFFSPLSWLLAALLALGSSPA